MSTMPMPVPPTVGAPASSLEDAHLYLSHHGIVGRVPTIRSSDFSAILNNPFLYYLTRRLGFSNPFRWSEALSRGTWAHKRLEYVGTEKDGSSEEALDKAIEERNSELMTIGETYGFPYSKLQEHMEREEQDARCAWLWMEAALYLEHPAFNGTLHSFLTEQHRILDREVRVAIPHAGTLLVTQLDALLLDHSNQLWIADYKTVGASKSGAVFNRLTTCPLEWQTRHYLYVCEQAFKQGLFHTRYKLPSDVKWGGMKHIAIAKPSIEFGQNDRAFTSTLHEISRGPRKGTLEERREYFGPPVPSRYVQRCRDWYGGTGEYLELATERQLHNPSLGLSCTTNLDENDLAHYHWGLDFLTSFATCPPYPGLFPKTSDGLTDWSGQPSFLVPFFHSPIERWPALYRDLRLMTAFRDEDLSEPFPSHPFIGEPHDPLPQ